MKRAYWTTFLLMATIVLGPAAVPAPTGPARDDFKDIVVYNIFNPDRGPRPEPKPRPVEKKEPPPPRVERLTLTGVILSENGAYGFFDGSDRDYQAVRQQGEKLGPFTLAKLTIDGAELFFETNRFTLKLRGELSRQGDAPWKSSTTTTITGGGGALSSSVGSPGSSAASSAAPSPADDERRKKLLELLRKKRESAK
jgi:hypothetical protein